MTTNLMIVDDSPITRKFVRRAALQAGAEDELIREAGNGQEALDLLGEASSDIVLLDLNMPVMNGYDFARAVREDEGLKNLGIIVVSTEANVERLEELESLGIDGYLHKPFEPEVLRDLIAEILEQRS
jgi:two-component system, chemotaxis family, chemotaxis protein CheY